MDTGHDPRLLDRPQTRSERFTRDELNSAGRNHAFYLEMLALDTTPAGAHYVVLHFDIPLIDAGGWRLEIGGLVPRPMTLTLDELKRRPRIEAPVTLECAGNGRALMKPRAVTMPWFVEGVSTAMWTGISLRELLAEAGVDDVRGRHVVFTGRDRGITKGLDHQYERALPLDEALRPEVLLAYEMGHKALPPQHGFPLRLVVPGWYGMASVKWLERITVTDREFDGYHQRYSYRNTRRPEQPGLPVTRINVRSLFVPPGFAEGDSRRRYAKPGPHRLVGRAWSGVAPVTAVEFSSNGGRTWQDAELQPGPAPYAWQRWVTTWDARPGTHVLCSRASDACGNSQPLQPSWNLQGMGNNVVYRVEVIVGVQPEARYEEVDAGCR